MQTISSADACERLDSLLDELARGQEAIAITRDGESAGVLVSTKEFEAMQETLYLLSSSANAERIRQGLADYSAGRLQAGELCD
jgi:antitoxin YefM